jgi:hypothetical protein
MKRARSFSSPSIRINDKEEDFFDSFPLDCWRSITEQAETLDDWLTFVLLSKSTWQACGGFARVVEKYIQLKLCSLDMWNFRQPILKGSTYFAPAVLKQLKQLPWLQHFRSLPLEHRSRCYIAGGYVRTELIHALSAHDVKWLHPLVLKNNPRQASDVDVWFHRLNLFGLGPNEIVNLFLTCASIAQQSEVLEVPHNTAWSFEHPTLVPSRVECILH